jgi:CheY-like chemotaxis protein
MPHSGKVALLIVEDDSNIRYLLEVAAQRSDLFDPIRSAPDGQAALDLLQASDTADLPVIIVTDLSMPRVTGLELLRALKNDVRLRSIPAAVISSSDVPNDRELALQAGACSFVHKPYGVDSLMRVLIDIRESCVATAGAPSSV